MSSTTSSANAPAAGALAVDQESARARLGSHGRNDLCPCGSGKKYKKCHLASDEATASPPAGPPDPATHVQNAWRLFEQRRPGAAEKEFKAALALKADLVEAQVGVGLARLSAGNSTGAREALSTVVAEGAPALEALRKEGVTDGFSRAPSQPLLRAAHALGCLAYDEERYDEALDSLAKVYAVDTGPVGTEARLIAAKTLVKTGKPAEAVPLLEDAAKAPHGPGRAHMGLVLAHFQAGDQGAASAALGRALEQNQHLGKAVLGHIRKQVDNPLGAPAGSREEAALYAQTYGDVWDEKAKDFLTEALDKGPQATAPAPSTGDSPGASEPAAP